MRVKVHGPMSTYAPHPSGGGEVMTSWGPDQVVDVNDTDERSVAFYERLIEHGRAELMDDEGLAEAEAPATVSAPPAPAPEPPAEEEPVEVEVEEEPPTEEEPVEVEEDESPDYDMWTLQELKDEIARLNKAGADLKVSGNKADLAARLREHDPATV